MFRIRSFSIGAMVRMAVTSLRAVPSGALRIFLCVADHYEPIWHGASEAQQRDRVSRWVAEYPRSVEGLYDSRGQTPQHTFFYPAEAYDAQHLERLAQLCHDGFGSVEVHLHHDQDTSEHLRATLEDFKLRLYRDHGLLAKNKEGEITYGFIHGNWALDNSLPSGRWCGVNNELTVLRETGCFADFTLPAAPSPAQTRTINSIYYAVDDPLRPKSHDRGVPARVGAPPVEGGLLMIQGPTMLNWARRRYGVLPTVENADLHGRFPPSAARLRLWLQASVHVLGRPEWLFVKLHTHGAPERNASMLLGEPMRSFHQSLAEMAEQNPAVSYYYVTAREMAGLVHQAERGAVTPDFDAAATCGAR